MKLIVNKDRSVIPIGTWGTKNENNYEILNFEFPEELEEYNKRIVYYLGDERVWDAIVDNKAYITNAITTKGDVKAYVWCTKENTEREADTDFRTMLFEMHFYENENADGIVPTEEQVDGFNTMLTAMNNKIAEVNALEQTIGAAEAQRQEAEATRVSNESTRESNESTRESNEQTRQSQEAERERKTNEAISSIQDKTAEYNANAEAKTTAFNNNATQKTNEFNSNYTQKVNDFNTNASTQKSEFNTNASSKTSAFNSNAETKTNAFNSNATEKTTAFNDNASTKTSEFNSNAESKTSAFNDNATQKTTNFDNNASEKTDEFNTNAQEKIDEYDEHIVEYQAQIDELQEEVDELSENMPWNTTEQATEIDITDAAKYSKNKMKVFGNTEQNSYQGYNLVDVSPYQEETKNGVTLTKDDEGNIILNGTSTTGFGWNANLPETRVLPTGTYTKSITKDNSVWSGITISIGYNNSSISGATIQPNIGTATMVCKQDTNYNQIRMYIGKETTFNNYKLSYMILSGEYTLQTIPDYEPYVGGQPSPSPDYPQPIHVVTGNNTIEIQGKNYVALNREGLETTHSYTHNYDSFSFGTKQYTKLPAGSYTMMFKLKSSDNGKFNKVQLKGPNNSDITILTLYRTIPSNYTEYVKTFTIAQPTEIRGIFTQNAEGTGTFTFKDIMVVAGTYTSSNVPEYDIYRSTNYPLNLGSLQILNIGSHEDKFLFKNGNWVIPNKVQKIDSYNGEEITTEYISTTGGLDEGATVYYIGTEDYIVEDETLIKQLNELYNYLKLVKGTDHITVTAEDLAPYMKLSYMQDLKSKLDNLDSRLSLLE